MDSYMDLTPLMRAAADVDSGILFEMIALNPDVVKATLFVKDTKGRTALDWARLSRNHVAVAMLRKAMVSNILESRADIVESHLDIRTQVHEANQSQINELFDALRNRNEVAAMRIINENRLYREEVESIGSTFFIDVVDKFGYSPLILAAGMNLIQVENCGTNLELFRLITCFLLRSSASSLTWMSTSTAKINTATPH